LLLSADWVVPVEGPPIRDGAVLVEEGRIAAVATAAELGTGERFEGAAIVPGLVNAHSHLEYAVYAGFGDGLAFAPWLALHVERKRRIDWDDMLAIARLGAAECLRSGITTTADYSFSGAAARACAELGLRAVVFLEVFGGDPGDVLEQFERTRARVEDAFSAFVRLGISPHAPYSVSADAWEACVGLGLPIGTHVAESAAEQEWLVHGTGPMAEVRDLLVQPTGETGTRMLEQRGLLDSVTIAAHCVHVDAEELDLLVDAGVGIAHCPRSNALLGCGIAPLSAFRAAGARVGIGTDSPASTPSFDAFEELRAALMAARAREQRPDALSASEALELATLGSARALGLETEIGSLEPGKRADLAVVSLAGSPLVPWEEPAAAVVLGGAPARVLLTVVDGVPRYRKGGTEWHELTAAASHARSRLLGRPGTRART
jgi:cytosine/adenosine deaminase-related metal-dependent hydrolase